MLNENDRNILLFRSKFLKQKDYWTRKLSGKNEPTDLLFDYDNVHPVEVGEGKMEISFPTELGARVIKLSKGSGLSIYILLLAALKTLIFRYTANEDITTISPINKLKVTGETINTLLFIRDRLEIGMTFKEVVLHVRQSVLEAYENQDYPYDKLLEYLFSSSVEQSRRAISNIQCSLVGIHDIGDMEKTKAGLSFHFVQDEDRLKGFLLYDPGDFNKTELLNFCGHFICLLTVVLENIEIGISDISFLSEHEKKQLLLDFNDNKAGGVVGKTVVNFIEEHAGKAADTTCLCCLDEQITYRELDEQFNWLAYLLVEKGVLAEDIIGIMMERSIKMVIGLLGIIKAGGAYMPIDPDYPQERIDYMLKDSSAKFLINDRFFRGYRGAVFQKSPPLNGNLAYIIYTSGSTGKPKGVMVEHAGMMNHIAAKVQDLQLTQESIIAQNASHMFDISVWQFFSALTLGGKTIIYRDESIFDPDRFISLLIHDGVAVLEVVPSYLSVMLEFLDFNYKKFESLRYILVTGETVTPRLVKKWFEKYPGIKMVNAYGPTEASDDITHFVMAKAPEGDSIPIGKPIRNFNIYIVDKNMNLCPLGVKGEICVAGIGVGRGYLNNIGKTCEVFMRDPLDEGVNVRLYKTGDLGRWLGDGTIEFFGRKDSQVKIRGFRIELGEIESRLSSYPGVMDAVVIVKEVIGSESDDNVKGEKYLCAFLSTREKLDTQLVRTYLSERLPDYMVPEQYVELEHLPLTPNGKIDRKALSQLDVNKYIKKEYIVPRTEVEKRLAEIWSKLLGLEEDIIGIDSNFFELGGHSLKSTILAARIHKVFNVKLSLEEIFTNPTIRGLAKVMDTSTAEHEEYASIQPAEKKEYYVLSSAQKRLYFLQEMEESGVGYNIPQFIRLEGQLDVEKLESIFRQLIRRHESFRTSFRMVDGEPVQRVHDKVEFEINKSFAELFQKRLPEGLPEAMIERFIRPFDMSRAPLLRVGLIRIEKNHHILMLDMHHIISDGASMGILVKDFMSLYEGRELPQPRIYYKDYAEWQIHVQTGIRQQETFWLKELAGEIPVLNLPTDYLRPRVQRFEGSTLSFNLGSDNTRALNALALRHSMTLYMVLLAVFDIFLAKLGNQQDIVVGTPAAGRRHADLEQIIGMFVNTLSLRNYPIDEMDFLSFLEEVKTRTISAFENQDYQYDALVEKIMPNRDVSRNPLFDVMFVLQNTDLHTTGTAIPGLKATPCDYEYKTSKFDLTLIGFELGETLSFTFEYSTQLFKQETLERFVFYYKNIIRSIVENPDQRICDLEILTEEEKSRILSEFNDTVSGYPKDKTIPELFAEQVDRNPDRIALVGANRHPRVCPNCLTYRQLNEQSNRLAGLLIEKGVLADSIVAIMMERSVEMIIGIMGILKSGGAYMPIDPEYPRERIAYMLKDSGARILINKSEIRNPKLETNPNVQKINVQNKSFEDLMVLDFEHLNFDIVSNFVLRASNFNSSNLAYIIYTSGTTGRPKGILTTHANAIRVVKNTNYIELKKDDRVLQLSNYAFDGSIFDIYGALLNGSALITIRKEQLLSMDQLALLIMREQITVFLITTALFNTMVDLAIDCLKDVRKILFGGERVSVAHSRKALEFLGKGRIIHAYGPTESTVYATSYPIERIDNSAVTIPIGRPISNTTIYILDKILNSVPLGIGGELYIGGDGTARGYLNRPDLTIEKFIKNPFQGGGRLYRSGDLGRWLEDGNIEFLGRIDLQVKLRGFRIELGEIESHLLKHPSIKKAVVMLKENRTGLNRYLCAYIVSEDEVSESELRKYLLKSLPDHMIPSNFVNLEELPVNPNGKIDHNALPDPEEHEGIHLNRKVDYMAPTSLVEEKLVEIWENVLGVANIGVNDNFFALGGDSIKTIQIASRLNTAGYKLDVKDILQYPEISLLAPLVKKQQRVTEQREVTGRVPLTPIQRWFFEKVDSDPHHFNQAVMLYSREGFDKKILEAVFTRIQEHHDALRNTFHWNTDSGEIVQTGHGLDYPLFLQEFDLKDHENSLAELNNKIDEIQAGIDLENGPLMKLGHFHLDDGDRLLIVIHHLVVDGISWRILFEDMETLYTQYTRGEKPALPPKTDSFKHWAEKLAIYADSKAFLLEKNYWNQLESNPVPRITRDLEGKDNFVKDTRSISFTLGEDETSLLLTKVNNAFRTEINDILLTMLGMGIRKTFAQDRVLIALEGHGREDILENIDISRTVGWFTGLFPVILDLSYADDTSRQLKEIKETLRKIPYKGIGYGILRYLSGAENKKAIEFKLEPQISFNYLGQFDEELNRLSFCEIADEPVGNAQSLTGPREFDIDVSAIITDNRLSVSVFYNETHLKSETMAALLENFQAGLRHIIAYCTTRETIEYSPSDFTFKGLTIESLDRLMKEYQGIEDIYTLSPMQEGLLFQALVDHSSHSYFEQVALRMEGELDIALVEKSLNDLFKRHDILRTAFVCKNIDSPVQIVLKERTVNFHYQDISEMGDRVERELFITKFKEYDKQRSFDLSKDVLMRVSVFRLDRMEYEFIWSFHHILMDGWCLGILNAEFLNIYHGNLEKEEYRLPEIKPYRSYIQWLEKLDKEESLHYWRSYMASYEEPAVIPKKLDIKKEAIAYRNEKVFLALGKEKTAALNNLAAENRVTLNTMLQVVWGILLGKFNGKKDVVFGAVVSGRPYQLPGVESMVGLFINSIPMRVKFTGGQEFNRLVQIIQQESIAGEPYHYHPLADIQSHSPLKQSLFDHLFIFENYPIAEQIEGYQGDRNKFAGLSLKVTSVDVFDQTHYDFNIILSASDQINITFQYNGSVVDNNFVQHLAERFRLAIDRVIENKEAKIGELISPSPEEMNRILYEFNNTGVEFPENKTIHESFTEQAERTPDRIALVGANRHLRVCPNCMTYRELNDQSDRLAGLLIEKGVLADKVVGIMMERSIEMMIGVYGILKSGGAYLPIDPGYPQERLDYMLADSNAWILLATEECKKEIIVNCQLLIVNCKLKNVRSLQAPYRHSSFINHHSNQLAYIIYTSGSTGRPKGVIMQHRSVVNRLNWMQRAYPIDENDILIQKTPVTFDVSVWELFWWSFYGSSLYLPAPGVEKNPEALVQAIEMHRVTTIHFVPSMLNVWLDYIDNTIAFKRLMSLKQVFSSGEALEVYQVVKFNNGIGKINCSKLVNLYGPTEACVDVSYFNCWTPVGQDLERIPIGKPIDNIGLYVVSEESVLQPVGIAGELLIAGVGLAAGYLNKPELTAEKFRLNRSYKFYRTYIFYKTGDLARWLPDGNVEFLGRIDHQVKVRGFRIELGEIEARLMDHPWVKEAVVIPRQDKDGDKKLCAYVVLDVAGSAQVGHAQSTVGNELRTHLLKHLPEYMVPPYLMIMDRMPLSANGKLDRRALPEPEINASGEYVGPRDEAEKGIVFIVADILGMDPARISVRANFFNMGLNSISILKLAQRISEEFRIDFPIGTLFTSPSVEGVVADMKKGYHPGASRRAVLLNRKRAAKNLFLISGDGRVYIFKELALLLEGHFNVYGVQGKGFMDTGPLPRTRREVFADLLREIKLVQPEGPYLLGGHCYGAVISYELARILEERKETVAKIVLLDEPALMTDDIMDRLVLLRWYNKYRNTVETLERIVKSIETKLGEKRHTDRGKMPIVKSGSMPEDLEARRIEINKNYNRLFPNPLHYTRIVNIPLLVFKTDQSVFGPTLDPRWNPATIARTSRKNVEVVDIAGDHLSMFTTPHVEVLAKLCIERI